MREQFFDRHDKIQMLRAFSIIGVVAIHSGPEGQSAVFIRPLVNFCVAMFLFLSGYLTKNDIPDIGSFYKKRILRVWIPYTVWSVIYTIAYHDYQNFIVNYLTARCCGIYYFIAVYIQLTLLAPFIKKLARSKYLTAAAVLVTPAAILVQYIMVWNGHPLEFPWNANNFFVWFLYYYIGMLLSHQTLKTVPRYKRIWFLYFGTVLLQIAEGQLWFQHGNFNMATTQIKLTSMLTSTVAILLAYFWLNSEGNTASGLHGGGLLLMLRRILVAVGNASFGIYLSHLLLISVLRKTVYVSVNVPFPLNVILVVSLTSVFILAGSKLCGGKIGRAMGFA